MPIQTPNGVLPKRSRLIRTYDPSARVLHNGLAAAQNGVTAVGGTTYSSPFTESAKPLWNYSNDNSTQVRLAPLRVESAGDVVPIEELVRTNPWEKGTHFSTTASKQHALIARKGGPDPKSDTPSHPDDQKIHIKARRKVTPSSDEIAKNSFFPSFLRSGGTIGGHVDPEAGTSSQTSRWHVTKRGAVTE